jgi:hypothetical protein
MDDVLISDDELIRELRAAKSPHAEAIAEGLANSTMRIEPQGADISVKELLRTYTTRREHLSRLTGAYFEQIQRDVADLCRQLEVTSASVCELIIIWTHPRDYYAADYYAAFRDAGSGRILGCWYAETQRS